MSLINEALRKARREAAERERRGAGHGVPLASTAGGGSSRLGAAVVAGGLIAVAAGLSGAGAAWWFLGNHTPQEVASSVSAAGTPGGERSEPVLATVAPETTAANERNGAPEPRVVPPSGAARSATEMTTPAPEPGATERNDGAVAPAPAGVESGVPRIDAETVARAAGGQREFRAEADLGYARLELDYIVFRDTDPFAQVNGLEVHVGDFVAGFEVVAVARDHVWLRDERGPLILNVK